MEPEQASKYLGTVRMSNYNSFCAEIHLRIDRAKTFGNIAQPLNQPGIQRVQALADISRSALCCHSNETRIPIANLPNSAQIGAPPTIPPKLHPGP